MLLQMMLCLLIVYTQTMIASAFVRQSQYQLFKLLCGFTHKHTHTIPPSTLLCCMPFVYICSTLTVPSLTSSSTHSPPLTPSSLSHTPCLTPPPPVVFRQMVMQEDMPFAMSAIGHMPLLTITYACVGGCQGMPGWHKGTGVFMLT